MRELDAVSTGIYWDRLTAITNEILSALVRTSFSPNVRESYDLACMLFDADGRSIAQGTYSVPSFTGSAPRTVRHMLAKFPPETLQPGDVLATNDPWMGTGHLFDINVLRPIFRRGRLIGYSLSITHLPDIGGIGFTSTAREIYEEGLRFPILKLVKAGEPNREFLELVAENVRVPEETLGDIQANVTCTEVGARLLGEFMDEVGLDDLRPIADQIIAITERAMRDRIREIPDGVYDNRIEIEGRDAPITLAARVGVAGDAVTIDFDGTSGVVPTGINVPITYSAAFAAYAIKCITVPHLPNNMGCILPIEVTGPPNCILNALPPHPTAGRHSVGHHVTPLVFGALAAALPDRVQADSGMQSLVLCQGTHRDGRPISSIFYSAGGFGALGDRDGAPTLPCPSNMIGAPMEVWENLTCMTFARKALLPDSGGPGRARGGLGQEIVMRNDSGRDMIVSCFAMRTRYPARGFLGGLPGTLRQLEINGRAVDPKGRHTLRPGDTMKLVEAGGGGFGDPRERAPDRVRADVAEGLVSAQAALRAYGIEVLPR